MTDKLRAAAEMALEALERTMEAGMTGIKVDQAAKALRQALDQLPDTTIMIERTTMSVSELADRIKRGEKWQPLDTGIDRGAWADVPDATKWVDELRGDEPEFECPRCGHCCQFVEPPNSTTDVVEPEPFGWLFKQRDSYALYKLLRGDDVEWTEKHNPYWIKVSPLYTAPPKREWQGLTEDERRAIMRQFGVWTFSNEWLACLEVEAKLKEKNSAS